MKRYFKDMEPQEVFDAIRENRKLDEKVTDYLLEDAGFRVDEKLSYLKDVKTISYEIGGVYRGHIRTKEEYYADFLEAARELDNAFCTLSEETRARLDRALNRAEVWENGIICGELDDDNAERFYTWFTDIVKAAQEEVLNDLEAEYEAAYEDETLKMYIEDGVIAEWFPDVYITEDGEAREDIAYTAIYA